MIQAKNKLLRSMDTVAWHQTHAHEFYLTAKNLLFSKILSLRALCEYISLCVWDAGTQASLISNVSTAIRINDLPVLCLFLAAPKCGF